MEFGGDDQWRNMLGGTELIGRKLGKDAHAMTITLLLNSCLLYTSDAAAERSSVDLGGSRNTKKKKKTKYTWHCGYNSSKKQACPKT